MDSYLLDGAVMDPTWMVVFGAIGVIGAIATTVVLVRQAPPPMRIDPGRVARRREAARRLAH